MGETIKARQRILEYMAENNIKYSQLAIMTGYNKSEIHAAVSGTSGTPKSNEIVLKLIQMFGLA